MRISRPNTISSTGQPSTASRRGPVAVTSSSICCPEADGKGLARVEVYGLDVGEAPKMFREQLVEWQQRAADADAPLSDDRAVAEVLPRTPVMVGTGGPKTAALAARCGFGVLLPPVEDHAKNRPAAESYRDAGGAGPTLAGQWVWIGDPPPAGIGRGVEGSNERGTSTATALRAASLVSRRRGCWRLRRRRGS